MQDIKWLKRLFLLVFMTLLFLPSVSAISYTTELATTIETTTGTVITGDFESTHAVDGINYQVEEVTETPGLLFSIIFTTTGDSITSLSLYGHFEGNPAHTVEGELYNWVTAEWDTVDTYPDAVADTWYNATIGSSNYVSGGQIILRMNHITAGSAGHYFYLDYVEVVTIASVDDSSIFYQLFLSLEMWGYLGPFALVVIGVVLADRDKFLGVFWFIIECLFVSRYLELVEATPDYWWHILIILMGGLLTCILPLFSKRRQL